MKSKVLLIAIVLILSITLVLSYRNFNSKSPTKVLSDLPTITYFEAHAGGCGWYLRDLATNTESKLGQFHTDCSGANYALSPTEEFAVVWFDQNDEGTMQWFVQLQKKQYYRIPAPNDTSTNKFAFDKSGDLFAFSMHENIKTSTSQKTTTLEYEGRNFTTPASDNQLYGIAVAHIWWNGSWKESEIAVAGCCQEGAQGIYALKKYQEISGTTSNINLLSELLLTPYIDAPVILDTLTIAQAHNASIPTQIAGKWHRLVRKDWDHSLLVRTAGLPPAPLIGMVLIETKEGLKTLPAWIQKDKELISLQQNKQYVLITDALTGNYPKIYDINSLELIVSSTIWQGTTFWPFAPKH